MATRLLLPVLVVVASACAPAHRLVSSRWSADLTAERMAAAPLLIGCPVAEVSVTDERAESWKYVCRGERYLCGAFHPGSGMVTECTQEELASR